MVDEAVVTEQSKFTVTPPDFTDNEALANFIQYLEGNVEQRGVKKLLTNLNKYKAHVDLIDAFAHRAKATINYINGVRTHTTNGSLRKTAQKFYESLNTRALRLQCTLFDVDYDSYETQEAIIDTLVGKHVAMINNGKAE